MGYNWLIDDGSGNLVHGPPVDISTPTFTCNPPVAAAPAFVVAVVVPPPPPVLPPKQFGDASWVKEIKTTTHNPNKIQLNQLVGDGRPQPWANGEAPDVETEWKLLETEFANPGNPTGVLQGANEDLPGGDKVITRPDEFYKYIGPVDAGLLHDKVDYIGAEPLSRRAVGHRHHAAVKEAIERNQPGAGLDRLHSFTVKFVRTLDSTIAGDRRADGAAHTTSCLTLAVRPQPSQTSWISSPAMSATTSRCADCSAARAHAAPIRRAPLRNSAVPWESNRNAAKKSSRLYRGTL